MNACKNPHEKTEFQVSDAAFLLFVLFFLFPFHILYLSLVNKIQSFRTPLRISGVWYVEFYIHNHNPIECGMVEEEAVVVDVLEEGPLLKAPRVGAKDKFKSSWKERHFILFRGVLAFQRTRADKKSRKEIQLKDCSVVDANEFTGEKFTFKITELSCGTQTFLKAQSEEEKHKWIEAIQRAIVEDLRDQLMLREDVGASSPKQLSSLPVHDSQGVSSSTSIALEVNIEQGVFPLVFGPNSEYSGPLVDGNMEGKGKIVFSGHVYQGYFKADVACGNGVFIHESGMRYEGDWADNRPHGLGTLMFPNGAVYIGRWMNGKRHGDGVMLSMDGCKYEGSFFDNEQHGHGILLWPNGNQYIGEFQHNHGHGKGKFEYSDGIVYEGSFAKGKFHGQGSINFYGFRVYLGKFNSDSYDGPGVLKFDDGGIYEGYCRRHMRHGKGVMKWLSGAIYDGSWNEDLMEGIGTYTSAQGQTYSGEFKAGLRNGHGIINFKDGRRYEGSWSNDKINGFGTMYYPSGNMYEGYWSRGNKHGHGVYVWIDGRKFEGEFVEGIPNGHGIFINAAGDKFSGNYFEGKKHGKGDFWFSDGRHYVGDWDRNFMHGTGKMRFPDQSFYEGHFRQDAFGPHGLFQNSRGDVYEGLFDPSGRFSSGIITYVTGNTYQGQVSNLKRNGVGVYSWALGERFEGHWKDDYRHGYGIMYYLDGRVSEAVYKNDRCSSILIRHIDSSELPAKPLAKSSVLETSSSKLYLDNKVLRNKLKTVKQHISKLKSTLKSSHSLWDVKKKRHSVSFLVKTDADDEKDFVEVDFGAGEEVDRLENLDLSDSYSGPQGDPSLLMIEDMDIDGDEDLGISKLEKDTEVNPSGRRGTVDVLHPFSEIAKDELLLDSKEDEFNSPSQLKASKRPFSDKKLSGSTEVLNLKKVETVSKISSLKSIDSSPSEIYGRHLAAEPSDVPSSVERLSLSENSSSRVGFDFESLVKSDNDVVWSKKAEQGLIETSADAISRSKLPLASSRPLKTAAAKETPDTLSSHKLPIEAKHTNPTERKETIEKASDTRPNASMASSTTDLYKDQVVPLEHRTSTTKPMFEPPSSGDGSGVDEGKRFFKAEKRSVRILPITDVESHLILIPIHEWTQEQACAWLKFRELEFFIPVMENLVLDGSFLANIELASLDESAIGMKIPIIKRRNLVFAVERFKGQQAIKLKQMSPTVGKVKTLNMGILLSWLNLMDF